MQRQITLPTTMIEAVAATQKATDTPSASRLSHGIQLKPTDAATNVA